MNEATTRYVDAMYEGMEGYVYGAVSRGRGDWKQFYFQFPEQREELLKWVDAWSPHTNVYLAPSLFIEKKSTKEFWKCSNYVWVEFDGNYDPAKFAGIPEPHIIIQSSLPRHMHCYWKVHPGASREAVESLNRRLSRHLGADYSGFDCNQVLRPPGTKNHKPGKDLPVVEILNPDVQIPYPLDWFSMVPELPMLQIVPNLENDLLPIDYVYKQYPDIKRAVERILEKVLKSDDADRSDALMQLAYTCAEQGIEAAMILSAVVHMDLSLHKFVGRSDMWIRYQECVERALIKHPTGILTGITIIDKQEVPIVTNPFKISTVGEFLTFQEDLTWVWSEYLPTQGGLVIAGESGIGKTQISLNLAQNMVLGEPFLGQPITEPLTVLYMSLDMHAGGLKFFLQRQMSKRTAEQVRTIEQKLYISYLGYSLDLLKADQQKAFDEAIATIAPNVIFFDTFSDTYVGSQNDDGPMQDVMTYLRELREKHGVGVVLNHYLRKDSPTKAVDVRKEHLIGSSVVTRFPDTIFVPMIDDDKQFYMPIVKSRLTANPGAMIPRMERHPDLTFTHTMVDKSVPMIQQAEMPTITKKPT